MIADYEISLRLAIGPSSKIVQMENMPQIAVPFSRQRHGERGKQ